MGVTRGTLALILIFNLVQIFCISEVFSKDLGKSCVSRNGTVGTCTKIHHCDEVLNEIKKRPFSAFAIVLKSRCSIGLFEVTVCCPGFEYKSETKSEKVSEVQHKYKPLYPPQCGLSIVPHNRIVGGTPATLGSWPWMAAVGIRFGENSTNLEFTCGGTLVSSRHIVTAAHCLAFEDTVYVVRLGEHDLKSTDDGAHPIDVIVQNFTIHPNYNDTTQENDIAVLKLAEEITFTDQIRPICLPLEDHIRNRNFNNTFPYVTGWGSTSYEGPSSSFLLEVEVPVIENARCVELYANRNAVVDDRTLCAGYSNGGKDACQGDSGGPLMFPDNSTFYLIGVVSSGFRCALAGYPGIYTRVTHFLHFILSSIN